jgi:hypothetical protein
MKSYEIILTDNKLHKRTDGQLNGSRFRLVVIASKQYY